jgi:hypothetical protein
MVVNLRTPPVTKFSEAVSRAKGKVLLHCTVAWRASHCGGNPMMVDKGAQPIEEFLNRRLPTLGHPKP